MHSFETIKQTYHRAYSSLKDAINQFNGNLVMRDGILQRFEYCTELTRKTLKKIMEAMGYTPSSSPKGVIQEAYNANLIEDPAIWYKFLDARNALSHVYDEDTCDELFAFIIDRSSALLLK